MKKEKYDSMIYQYVIEMATTREKQ